jgi:HlyD family secretion protein
LFLVATDLTKMQVDTSVSEGDIGGVKNNALATFTVEAFPNRRFEGVVSQVRQAPQAVQNVVTYDVVVSARNAELLLKPGMTANVRIIVDQRPNAVRVPDQALRYTPGGVNAAGNANANRTPTPPPGLGGALGGGRGGGGRGGGGGAGAGRRGGNAQAPAQNTGEPGAARVYVLRDGKPTPVTITVGLDDDTNTEIVQGDLKEGDRVIVSETAGKS